MSLASRDLVLLHWQLTIFELKDGLILRVTDFWPDPDEPGPRMSVHVERYSGLRDPLP